MDWWLEPPLKKCKFGDGGSFCFTNIDVGMMGYDGNMYIYNDRMVTIALLTLIDIIINQLQL